MLDRKTAPPINDIHGLKLPKANHYKLDNGIGVYEVNIGTQEIVKLEIVFNAGRPNEKKKLAARSTASLLKEGTQQYSAATIADQIDFYGGTLSVPVNLDTSNLILYSLNKHFAKLLPIVADMLSAPTFPQEELDMLIQRNQQRLQVDLTKNDVVAYRQITELIYDPSHPYGYNSYPETYGELTRNDLLTHFENNYVANNCMIFLSGKIDEGTRELLNMYFGRLRKGVPVFNDMTVKKVTPKPMKYNIHDTVQTAIRIGGRMFNRQHKDYHGMNVLNTILGGYFGSRLMNNIREDKGYTYNIYSSLDAMKYDGYFYVGTEVGNEFVDKSLQEIYYEFDQLKNELVDEEELNMVRNYLLGNMLTMIDGAFNISDVVKTIVIEDLPETYFSDLIHTIKTIDAKEIQRLSQQYLNKDEMWEVIVGG